MLEFTIAVLAALIAILVGVLVAVAWVLVIGNPLMRLMDRFPAVTVALGLALITGVGYLSFGFPPRDSNDAPAIWVARIVLAVLVLLATSLLWVLYRQPRPIKPEE